MKNRSKILSPNDSQLRRGLSGTAEFASSGFSTFYSTAKSSLKKVASALSGVCSSTLKVIFPPSDISIQARDTSSGYTRLEAISDIIQKPLPVLKPIQSDTGTMAPTPGRFNLVPEAPSERRVVNIEEQQPFRPVSTVKSGVKIPLWQQLSKREKPTNAEINLKVNKTKQKIIEEEKNEDSEKSIEKEKIKDNWTVGVKDENQDGLGKENEKKEEVCKAGELTTAEIRVESSGRETPDGNKRPAADPNLFLKMTPEPNNKTDEEHPSQNPPSETPEPKLSPQKPDPANPPELPKEISDTSKPSNINPFANPSQSLSPTSLPNPFKASTDLPKSSFPTSTDVPKSSNSNPFAHLSPENPETKTKSEEIKAPSETELKNSSNPFSNPITTSEPPKNLDTIPIPNHTDQPNPFLQVPSNSFEKPKYVFGSSKPGTFPSTESNSFTSAQPSNPFVPQASPFAPQPNPFATTPQVLNPFTKAFTTDQVNPTNNFSPFSNNTLTSAFPQTKPETAFPNIALSNPFTGQPVSNFVQTNPVANPFVSAALNTNPFFPNNPAQNPFVQSTPFPLSAPANPPLTDSFTSRPFNSGSFPQNSQFNPFVPNSGNNSHTNNPFSTNSFESNNVNAVQSNPFVGNNISNPFNSGFGNSTGTFGQNGLGNPFGNSSNDGQIGINPRPELTGSSYGTGDGQEKTFALGTVQLSRMGRGKRGVGRMI